MPVDLPEDFGGKPKDKPKKAYFELNKSSLAMAGVSIVLAIVSIVLLVASWYRFQAKTGFQDGLALYDANQRENAADALLKAVKWDAKNSEPRNLLAKIYVELKREDEAITEYDNAIALGGNSAAAHVGRGVAYLHKADREKDAAKARKFAGDASEAFKQAKAADSACLEAEIGLASAQLLVGVKCGIPAELEGARRAFADLKTRIEGNQALRATVTREGFIDLYAGFARASYVPGTYSPAVADAFKKAHQLRPVSARMIRNEVIVESQKFLNSTYYKPDKGESVADLTVSKYMDQYLSERAFNSLPEEGTALKSAIITYYLSFIQWVADVTQNAALFDRYWGKLRYELFKTDLGAQALGSACAMSLLVSSNYKNGAMVGAAQQFYEELLKNPNLSGDVKDPKFLKIRTAVRNNRALIEFLKTMDSKSKGLTNWRVDADPVKADLEAALKDSPNFYATNRNAAVLYAFIEEVDKAAEFLKKAESAAGPAERADLDAVKKWMGEKRK